MDAPAAQDLRRLAEVGDRPVRAVPHVHLVDREPAGLVDGNDVAGRVRQRDERRQRVEVDLEALRELGVGIGPVGLPGPVGAAVEVRRHAFVGGKEAGLGARLDSHVRDRESLVDRQRLGPRTDELEHHVRAAADPDLGDHSKDQVLARDERPLLAAELDLDRARHGLPELARRQARGDVGRAEAGSEGAERAVRAGVRVAAGDHGAGDDPALLDEHRVFDPAPPLTVVGDALSRRPLRQQLLELGRPGVLRRNEVIGDDHDLRRVEDRLDAHLLHRPEGHRAGDVVRQDDIATNHDEVAWSDVVRVAVGEQDLLGERVGHLSPHVTTRVVIG